MVFILSPFHFVAECEFMHTHKPSNRTPPRDAGTIEMLKMVIVCTLS